MRWVLDTDVIVAAMRSPSGASAAILEHALDGRVTLVANVALMLEYEAVCTRADQLAAAGLSAGDGDVFVAGLAALVEPAPSHFVWRPLLRDPSDEMVLEAAVNGAAEAIVSFNHRDFGDIPASFGLKLWRPREALRRITR